MSAAAVARQVQWLLLVGLAFLLAWQVAALADSVGFAYLIAGPCGRSHGDVAARGSGIDP